MTASHLACRPVRAVQTHVEVKGRSVRFQFPFPQSDSAINTDGRDGVRVLCTIGAPP